MREYTIYCTVNQEIFVHDNIHVLNVCVNKICGCPWKHFNMKICQVYIIEIIVYVLPIDTSYLAIATFRITCAKETDKGR